MEIFSPAKNDDLIKNYENIPQTPKEVGFFWGRLGVILLLLLAISIDIMSIILTIIDLGTAGIVGWILRILFTLLYVGYFIWFWIESNKFGYSSPIQTKEFAQKTITEIKKRTKTIIYLLRIILATSIFAKWLPIIGAIIDALPIETLSVIFLFYLWPKLINKMY